MEKMGIGGEPFTLKLNSKEFAKGDILMPMKLRVLDEPYQVMLVSTSRWWIVRMWRKLWGIKKYEGAWTYKVKIETNDNNTK